jgi:LacI family transcriptional regulator
VVVRRSTDVLAVADRETIDIVRYVRDHACQRLTPAELARQMAMSRSTLERRFAKYLGHSVECEIRRARLNRVKELLTTSDLSLGEIADLAGFSYVETMQRTFKNSTGQTPGQYRNSRRVAGTVAISGD